ncbi:MAG TPA: hypothetical protein VLM16_04050 [Ginsengibacter sp.]|nr:hypothetical protein [Ginsengibacter sp.]
MSLDNIQLPAFLYQSIFKNNLVLLQSKNTIKSSKKESKLSFLGGNEKKIIFIGKDNRNKFLGDDQMKFLNDLLNACHLTMADIAFLNYREKYAFTYNDLTEQLSPKKVLIFGVSSRELDLPFEIPFFQVQNFHEQIYLISPALEEIQLNKELKKQLWNCFQKIFNIQKQK